MTKHLMWLLLLPLCGCSTVEVQRELSRATNKRVTLYGAAGNAIHIYHSAGTVYSEDHSDGWYFRDRETGKLTMVAGTVEIVDE